MSTQTSYPSLSSRRLVVAALIAICALGAIASLDAVRRSVLGNGFPFTSTDAVVTDPLKPKGRTSRQLVLGRSVEKSSGANRDATPLERRAASLSTSDLADLSEQVTEMVPTSVPAINGTSFVLPLKQDNVILEGVKDVQAEPIETNWDVHQPSFARWSPPSENQTTLVTESATAVSGTVKPVLHSSTRVAQVSNHATADTAGNGTTQLSPSPLPEAQTTVDKMTLAGVAIEFQRIFGSALASGIQGGFERNWATSLTSRSLSASMQDFGSQQAYAEPAATAKGIGGRIWLGIRSGERGIKLSYWSIDGKSLPDDVHHSSFEPVTFRGSTYLHASAFDIEIDQPFCVYGVEMAVTTGARYVSYELSDAIFGLARLQKDMTLSSYASAHRETTAMGFTASLSGRYPLHLNQLWSTTPIDANEECSGNAVCCPVWLYWNLRTASVWGDVKAEALTEATAVLQASDGRNAFATSRDYAVASSESKDLQGQFELQIGFETRRMLAYLPGEWVLRGGLEYRRWEIGDVLASTQSYAFISDETKEYGGQASAVSNANDDQMELFALVFSIGVNY
jgi:hypothetical protein